MPTKITTKKITNLTWEEYKALRRLTLGREGTMRDLLDDYWEGYRTTPYKVYLLRDTETKKILSWALVFRFTKNSADTAYFYVPTRLRRKGYASRLMKAIQKDYPKVKVEAWDKRSYWFFKSHAPNMSKPEYGWWVDGIVRQPKKAKA